MSDPGQAHQHAKALTNNTRDVFIPNQGIDLCHKHDRKSRRTEPKSQDVYLRLLVKLYRFLARRTGAKFNRIILKRLFMSKIHRPPMSLARIIRFMNKPERENRIVVVVGTVTNDVRIFKVPKMTVSATTRGEKGRVGREEEWEEGGRMRQVGRCWVRARNE
ncbi:60S ribosomal protein L18 [Amphibalanus amphitrite]|uniref:Large ribosomal subunit protein eL18 n=1 Tax=Amphibalanus amphitrite TaxID=1232801 RepID=A0A6A4VLP6_AMPAM|nr:60S ribosomal protein L18 [Amphibalanus amphitrite]